MPLVRTKHDDQFVIFLLYVVIGQETQSLERKKLSYILEYVLIRIDWFPKWIGFQNDGKNNWKKSEENPKSIT